MGETSKLTWLFSKEVVNNYLITKLKHLGKPKVFQHSPLDQPHIYGDFLFPKAKFCK